MVRPVVPEVASRSNSFSAGNLGAESGPVRAVPAEEPNVAPSLESSVSPAEPASMDSDEPTDVPNGLELGFPPRSIPRHGPGYLALSVEKRKELVRLHNNLGHPEATLFTKFLAERKAEPKFIRAAGDYS